MEITGAGTAGPFSKRIMDIAKGDVVEVWAAGFPQRKAKATVLVISGTGQSIAVSFDAKPPFQIHDGWALSNPDRGQTLFAMRQESGSWREMLQGRLFEIAKTVKSE